MVDGIEIKDNKGKANVFANLWEKNFNDDNNPRFDSNHKTKIEKYFDTRVYEKEYQDKEKVTKF